MGRQDAYTRFEELAGRGEVDVVSVDVFDTLLFRTTLPEPVKFQHFGKAMYRAFPNGLDGVENPARYLQSLRLLAARIIYHQKPMVRGAREATLDEIYDCMLFAIRQHTGMSDSDCQAVLAEFRKIERELEVQDLTPNEKLVDTLERARRAGKRVIAVSDMYLSQDDLAYLLDEFNLRGLFDSVYVSSEYGFGKASGALYDEVIGDMDRIAPQICHIGDNRHSDYAVPVSKGIKAVHAPRSRWWRLTTRARSRLDI